MYPFDNIFKNFIENSKNKFYIPNKIFYTHSSMGLKFMKNEIVKTKNKRF